MPENEQPFKTTTAWLLAASQSFNIAVAQVVVAEYLLEPEINLVPGSIDYCNQVLHWRGNFVPVMDLSILLGGEPLDSKNIAVIAYQEYQGQKLQYMALKLYTGVEQIEVSDGSQCEIPVEYPEIMIPIVDSLFIHQDKLISVINIADLCNEGYRDYMLAMQHYQKDEIESAA